MKKIDADSAKTKLWLRKARRGDRVAWRQVLERYYGAWLNKYHGDLGTAVRKLYDTQDLVQSAIGDAMRDVSKLRNEAAFFTWVTSIIRHKLANARRRVERERPLAEPRSGGDGGLRDSTVAPDETASKRDSYLHTLDVILELFPQHPEAMAAVVMRFHEGCEMNEVVERLGRPRRTVYRWLLEGTGLLKRHLQT